MQIGLNLPVMSPGVDRDAIEAWCRAIDRGPFSCLAVGERINFPNPELTVTLSMAAAWTERVRLLYNVLVMPLHHEVLAAKQIATLDLPSKGRVTLAVGVGGREEDYAALDVPYDKTRLRRLETKVARMRRIWQGEKSVASALRNVEPLPVQPGGPPVLVGAIFPDSIERAAAWSDGICGFSFSLSAAEVGGAFELARASWKKAGRETPPRLVTGTWVALGSNGREQMDAYLERYLNFLGDAAEFVIPTVKCVDAQSVKDAAARAKDLGADELVLAPTTWDVDELKRLEDLLF